MAGVLAALDAEFVVRRARLPRVTPCPSWNGVLGCSRSPHSPLISMLSECGRVYLLRLTTAAPATASFEFEDALCVAQVLGSESDAVMSMCHAWTRRGDVLAVARDRQLTIYRRNDETNELINNPFEAVSTVSLRFAATTLDVLDDDETGRLVLAVGCAAGVMVYTASADGTAVAMSSSILEDVAVAIAAFSRNGTYLAVGTIDGRVVILRRTGEAFSTLDSAETFSKVLAAPRVTSITFSPTSDKLIATTRKGNVYVFARDTPQQNWTLDDTFASLVANPKGGATSQTLNCWWGSTASVATPIFALAGRSLSATVELYDVYSHSLLHTLTLPASNASPPESSDLHLMGIVSVPSSRASAPPRLVCIDSDACLTTIEWPFLEFACPR